jgi:hypothetical protein
MVMPAATSPVRSASTKPVDGGRVGHAQEVADGGLRDGVAGHRQQLVEDRFGVAHAAGCQPRDHRQCRRIDRTSVGLEDLRQLALDLGHGQATDVIPLQARQDGGREPGRLGGREYEHHELGRLLDRLEERIPCVARDLMGLIEDVDLSSEVAGRVRQPITQVTDLVDAAVRAASISRTSSVVPSRMATHASHVSHGSPSCRLVQLTAFATIRASDVLPVPRGPTNRIACDTRSVRTAFRSVSTTASWPTIWLKVWARQRR